MTNTDKFDAPQGVPFHEQYLRAVSEGIHGAGVTEVGGMEVAATADGSGVTVAPGELWYPRQRFTLEEDVTLDASAGDADHDRWDAVVFDIDVEEPVYHEGEPEEYPEPPAIGDDEFPLAFVYVPPESGIDDEHVLNWRPAATKASNVMADVVHVDGDHTIDGESYVMADSSGGELTVTLPDVEAGRRVSVGDVGGEARDQPIDVEPTGGDTIIGDHDATIDDDHGSLTLVATTDGWFVVAGGAGGGAVETVTIDSDYTTAGEQVVFCETDVDELEITLSEADTRDGAAVQVIDIDGEASTNPITMTPEGEEILVDADEEIAIDADWGALSLVSDGDHWFTAGGGVDGGVDFSLAGMYTGLLESGESRSLVLETVPDEEDRDGDGYHIEQAILESEQTVHEDVSIDVALLLNGDVDTEETILSGGEESYKILGEGLLGNHGDADAVSVRLSNRSDSYRSIRGAVSGLSLGVELPESREVYYGTDEQMLYSFDPETGDELWSIDLSDEPPDGADPFVSSVSIYEGSIIGMLRDDGYDDGSGMFSVDAEDGSLEWFSLTPELENTGEGNEEPGNRPVIDGGTAYMSLGGSWALDDAIYAVDTETGDTEWVWQYEEYIPMADELIKQGDLIVFGAGVNQGPPNAGLYALDVSGDPTLEWQYTPDVGDPVPDGFPGTEIVGGNGVWAGATPISTEAHGDCFVFPFYDLETDEIWTSGLVCLDAEDGTPVWATPLTDLWEAHDSEDIYASCVSTTLADSKTETEYLYSATIHYSDTPDLNGSPLVKIDAETGDIEWELKVTDEDYIGSEGSPSMRGDVVFNTTYEGTVIAVDVSGEEPDVVWETEVGHTVNSPTLANDIVVVGTGELFESDPPSEIVALDVEDGSILWESEVDGLVHKSVSPGESDGLSEVNRPYTYNGNTDPVS